MGRNGRHNSKIKSGIKLIMIRTFLLYLIFFFVPLVIYFSWVYFRAKHLYKNEKSNPGGNTNLDINGWPWAIVLGCLFVSIFLFFSAFIGGSSPESEYIPPSYKDGKIVPGKSFKREELE